jgi:ubiquinone/menaquinone biosynthesis C-methylase UbiE
MNSERTKPLSNITFRLMAFFLTLHRRFVDVRKPLKKAGVKEGQIILDFGYGPGHYTIAAAKMVGANGKVYALDIHPLAAQSVEKKARKEGLTNISTILSDRDTGLPDHSIDIALAYDMIHMVKDKQSLMKELHRVLKPNGILSVLVEHIKVEDVLKILEKDSLFSLRDRQGNLINLNKGKIS